MIFTNKINAFNEMTEIKQADQYLIDLLVELNNQHYAYADGYGAKALYRHRTSMKMQSRDVSIASIDPLLTQLRLRLVPYSWLIKHDKAIPHSIPAFMVDEDELQHQQLAVALHGPHAHFANIIMNEAKKNNDDTKIHLLYLITKQYHDCIQKIKSQPVVKIHSFDLTDRELQCLRLSAKQSSIKEIATLLKISPRTVCFHFENIIYKMKVSNKYQAIIKALELGIL